MCKVIEYAFSTASIEAGCLDHFKNICFLQFWFIKRRCGFFLLKVVALSGMVLLVLLLSLIGLLETRE